MDPVVEKFVDFGKQAGVILPTYYNAEGVPVRARIAPVLADSPARCLVSGFLGHGATYFCAYCLCTSDQLENYDTTSWTPRNSDTVRKQALVWKTIITLKGKEEEERKNGVRWSSLHALKYWDPVRHNVLGFMHNWLEGVLEDHLRILWGVGRDKAHEEKARARILEWAGDENWTESDVTESESELEGLRAEAEEFERRSRASSEGWNAVSAQTTPPLTPSPSSLSPPGTPKAPTTEYQLGDPDPNDTYIDVPYSFDLSEEHLLAIRECIRKVTLPTWVGRPPANLGESSHGSLRANDYLVLFSFILPLVVPEFLGKTTDLDALHLESFTDLVICTNIVCSYRTSNTAADLYTSLYTRYRKNIRLLFPYWPSTPNRHYAGHNGPMMKYWGPLPPLGEFNGEHIIGELQNIATNKKFREFK